MSTYKIDWMENKTTKTGKKLINATLTDSEGNQTDKVQIWDSFPSFALIMPGATVEGEIETKVNGQYTNITLQAPRSAKSAYSGGSRTASIEKAVQQKEASITKFQATKEESIKTASIMRDATLLTISQVGHDGIEQKDMQIIWEEWKKWLTSKWEAPF